MSSHLFEITCSVALSFLKTILVYLYVENMRIYLKIYIINFTIALGQVRLNYENS